MTRRGTTLALIGLLGIVGSAQAQDTGAAAALKTILGGDFGEGAASDEFVAAVRTVLPSEAATFPLASSAGGFTWTFDPALGVQTRRTQSFGPMFAERPFTNGRKKFNVGVAFQHTGYQSIAGQKLSDLQTRYSYQDERGKTFTETYGSSLSFSTDQTIISASYGVTDRLDVAVLVPIERIVASGSSKYTIAVNGRDLAPGGCDNFVYSIGRTGDLTFPVCSYTPTNSEGRSSGLGDVTLRGKVSFASMRMLDWGAGVDVRLPTGDDQQLLGVGRLQTKLMLMGSMPLGSVSPHFNVGYTFGGKGLPFDADGILTTYDEQGKYLVYDENGKFNKDLFQPSSEANYTLGVDIVAGPSVTVMGDVVGRSLANSAGFAAVDLGGGDQSLDVAKARLNLILGTVGTKIRIGNDFLFTASVVFPLNSAGIKPGVTPVVGFERAF